MDSNIKINKPYICKIDDTLADLNNLKHNLKDKSEEKYFTNYPTVYIHTFKKKNSDDYDVYIGESNDFFKRTREHFRSGKADKQYWFYEYIDLDPYLKDLYAIGHDMFNKSLTLDVENRLMHYLSSCENVKKVCNARTNPQNDYYTHEIFDLLFSKIWLELNKKNKTLFRNEDEIKNSALFKASPLHKLTDDQLVAKDEILNCISSAIKSNEKSLIFVDGDAGTGKTVLNVSVFYSLFNQEKNSGKDANIALIVNHNELLDLYRTMGKRLGFEESDHQRVFKSTVFINRFSEDNPVDVAFVDEAHLLLTQGKQAYTGKNQIKDIIERSKVTVLMFDKNQILTTEQYLQNEEIENLINKAKGLGNTHITLSEQLRVKGNVEVMNWIDNFTKDGIVERIPEANEDYEIKIYGNPAFLERDICSLAINEETRLSRLIATYDWEYNINSCPNDNPENKWCVEIGGWKKPWNYELQKDFNRKQKKEISELAWAEQAHTIGEVGSTFTIQGFDLDYAGVILGPSVKYRNGKIVYDPSEHKNTKVTRMRTLSNGCKVNVSEFLIKNSVRVLMTRGVKGLYIYAVDDELRNKLIKSCS